jgi:hypothetical protein
VWVFAAGLHPPSTATVLTAEDDDVLMTDGPFTEGREHIGGFTVIQAADLDEALKWGAGSPAYSAHCRSRSGRSRADDRRDLRRHLQG